MLKYQNNQKLINFYQQFGNFFRYLIQIKIDRPFYCKLFYKIIKIICIQPKDPVRFKFYRFFINYLFNMEQNEKKQQCRDQFNFIPFSLTPIFVHFQIPNFNSSLFQPITVLQSPEERIQSDVEKSVEGIEYFIRIFSPKQTAKSIQRRNQNMQMLCFEDSGDEEPDDVYNRRKKKASELMSREQQQVRIMLNIRSNSQEKYNAIIQFVKFLYDQKQSLTDVRTDYYSSKTFYALKNATIQQLRDLTKVMKKMLNNINKYQKKTVQSFQLLSSHLNKDSKIIQFLIIPRFLISKQKISRLIRDQQLQKNFQFLVIHDCLGHYNNQANKKMPQQKHIKYIKVLLTQRCGRQRFKKICSINHGNKFLKINGQAYHNLYQKGLQYLQYLDNSLKKGKKYETIKKDLEKMTKQSQETLGNSLTQNQSQNPLFSFKNIKQTLNKIEQEDEILKQQIQDILQQIPSDVKQTKNPRRMIKKMMSTPPVQQQKPLRKLGIRKIKTMQQKVAENIILVPPPHYSEV